MTDTTLPHDAQKLIVDWANQQDHWMRGLVSEVLATRKEISDGRIADFFQMFLQEKELAPGDTEQVPLLKTVVSDPSSRELFVINEVGNVQGVNALAPGQQVVFNSRLTVLFGENASGKTGYVRILKRSSGSRTAETILHNVNSGGQTSSRTPEARLSYTLNGVPQIVDWKNEIGITPFNRMDIFDSRGAVVHLEKDLNYVYTPGDLSLFPMIQHGLDAVRQRLEAEITRSTPQGNPFLPLFERGTKQFLKLETIGATSDLRELQALGAFTEADKALRSSLEIEINALQSNTPQAQLRLLQGHERLHEELNVFLTKIRRFSVTDYSTALTDARNAEAALTQFNMSARKVSEMATGHEKEWQGFIESAEDYIRATHENHEYPADGDSCIYCRQRLEDNARDLVRQYRASLNSEFQSTFKHCQERLAALSSPLLELDLSVKGRLADHIQGLSPEELSPLADFKPTIEAYESAKTQLRVRQELAQLPDISRLASVLDQEIGRTKKLKEALSADSQEREKALKEKKVALSELSARSTMSRLMPQIEAYVMEAKWVETARAHAKRFQPILKTLTGMSKVASQELMNHDFEKRFQQECERLRAPKVQLDFPGRDGKQLRRKSVASNFKPSDVLSEGEQKVIALADFLAELGLKPSSAPVVFDDPINSLDYKRMAEVVARIVELSATRQTIVFTHNIWFACLLLAEFEKNKDQVTYYDVSADDNHIGVVTKDVSPRADSVKSSTRELKVLIAETEKAVGAVQRALIEKGYEYLRNLCETIVETELLGGVTKRYQPNVMMGRLGNIRFIGLQKAAAATNEIFEKSCRFIRSHSQPLETLSIRQSLTDLKKDFADLESIVDEYRRS